jgi:hypothetical protein
MLKRINLDSKWRKLIGQADPDMQMKDIEIVLRGYAMLICGNKYKPTMTRFLNSFSKRAKKMPANDIDYFENLFYSFLEKIAPLGDKAFISKKGKFNIAMYEAIFSAVCKKPYENRNFNVEDIDPDKFWNLKENTTFVDLTQSHTTNKIKVEKRLETARQSLVG